MEGSVSGDGCRPTVGAMKYGDALAIAALATELGNTTLAATFTQRAGWIQREYLELLWNDDIDFFAVFKENLQNNSKCKDLDTPFTRNPCPQPLPRADIGHCFFLASNVLYSPPRPVH